MDILIKNIGGLPEDGDFTLTITPKGQVILGGCIFTSNFGKEVKAVELPSHGDLKDETDIIHRIDRFAEDSKSGFVEDVAQDIITEVIASPTIVEASE